MMNVERQTEKCRLCLKITPDYVSLHQWSDICVDKTNADVAMLCASILVLKDDGYPPNVCFTCVHQLSSSYQFRRLCETSEQTLREEASKSLNEPWFDLSEKLLEADAFVSGFATNFGDLDDIESRIDEISWVPDSLLSGKTASEDTIVKKCNACGKIYMDKNGHACSVSRLTIGDLLEDNWDDVGAVKEREKKPRVARNRNVKAMRRAKALSRKKITESLSFTKETFDDLLDLFDSEDVSAFKSVFEQKLNGESNAPESAPKPTNATLDGIIAEIGDEIPTLETRAFKLPAKCLICGKMFNRALSYREHVKRHAQITCYICGKKFAGYRSLICHCKNTHPETPADRRNLCSYCGYRSYFSIDRHIKKHLQEFPYECEVCRKKFHTKTECNGHKLRVHQRPDNFTCDACGKTFAQNMQLKRHQITHVTEKNFSCGVCSARFKAKEYLSSHMSTHSAEKFKCEYCHKLFSVRKQWRQHRRIHMNDKYKSSEYKPDYKTDFQPEPSSNAFEHYGYKKMPDTEPLKPIESQMPQMNFEFGGEHLKEFGAAAKVPDMNNQYNYLNAQALFLNTGKHYAWNRR